jgi:hypothetical protein
MNEGRNSFWKQPGLTASRSTEGNEFGGAEQLSARPLSNRGRRGSLTELLVRYGWGELDRRL